MHYLLDALLANALVALFLAVLAALVIGRSRQAQAGGWLTPCGSSCWSSCITPPLFSLHWPFNVQDASWPRMGARPSRGCCRGGSLLGAQAVKPSGQQPSL